MAPIVCLKPIAADSKTFLVVLESVLAAGDRYDGLIVRRTRNEAKRIALKDGALPFEPDPRFTVLTSRAEPRGEGKSVLHRRRWRWGLPGHATRPSARAAR